MSEGARIVHFRAENVKRLEVVEFDPGEGVVVVGGDNGEGKSSVLDAILYGLGGGRALPAEPIRKGQDKAEIVLDLGDFVVTRRLYRDKRDTLEVRASDGRMWKTPQRLLEALMEQVAFDPESWLRKPPKAQHAELVGIANLGIDIGANRADREAAYDRRRDVKRDLAQVRATLDELGEIPEIEARPSAVILGERRAALEANEAAATVRRNLGHAEESAKRQAEAVREAREKLAKFEKAQETAQGYVEMQRELAEALSPDVDLVPLDAELARAEEASAARAKAQQRDKLTSDGASLKMSVETEDEQIRQLDAALTSALQSADFPVEGLSVSETDVLFEGLPLNQASGAEQLRVALSIAMRIQEQKDGQKLRVVRILNGSLFDEKSMALVREMAAELSFQVWIERIEKDGASIVIEDGRIAP